MNIFRNRRTEDPNAAEVVKISSGQLFLVRPGTIRSSRECIYNDAMATIRRVPSVEHNFQLVITRVYEDGDQELLEDEDETDEERVFLISEELEFRTGETPEGDPAFIWRDLQGDVDEFYEFAAPGTNEPTRAFFETCIFRAMYERKYKKSADSTHDADLSEFIWQRPKPEKPKSKPAGKKKKTVPVDDGGLSDAMGSLSVVSDTRTPSVSEPTTVRSPAPEEDPSAKTLVSAPAILHLWDRQQGYFVEEGEFDAKIVQRIDEPFCYFMTAWSTESGQLLAHRIVPGLMQRWSPHLWALTWNYTSSTGDQSSWCFRFQSQEEFTKRLWETLNRTPWEKMKAEEQDYVLNSNVEDIEMKENDSDDEEAVLDELEEEEESEDEDDRHIRQQEQSLPEQLKKGKNKLLNVGYKGDRSYVTRGGDIGVFKHGTDGVEYYGTIAGLADLKGKKFDPKNVMLHEQDSKLVVMNPNAPHSLFNLDIERGKIVEEWKVHDDITVDHMAPESKYAQTTHEQTLVGASHNALFRIDPRVSGNKLVNSQYKQYAGKNKFSGVATTASGKLAVASEKGDIRLFDTIGKNAKTALPPLGDPILGVDATADGRWIVATTRTYLLLIDTLIGTGRYAGSLGFDRSFPADAKPQPKRLQLRPEHVAYMNHTVAFTPARFNIGEGQEENAIVTSTGQFVVAWDFAKVKKGQTDRYEIKKYEDLVVQDNFRFGDDKEIVVALQNNVLSLNKKQLRKPTRTSLAPETDRRRSRGGGGSGIVKEYR
ncbi:VID27 cytoplasmic protein [Vararia minispora EC-137]|uniref:VID27 cytoplasmic protein n=1 Tax=Vararia minispora EC-137 TaxID=1314806 RepID=A0ACB8QK08_9AGAM|nr:VID27 cytoplasmic protein [Vararia minispora EC-137]